MGYGCNNCFLEPVRSCSFLDIINQQTWKKLHLNWQGKTVGHFCQLKVVFSSSIMFDVCLTFSSNLLLSYNHFLGPATRIPHSITIATFFMVHNFHTVNLWSFPCQSHCKKNGYFIFFKTLHTTLCIDDPHIASSAHNILFPYVIHYQAKQSINVYTCWKTTLNSQHHLSSTYPAPSLQFIPQKYMK